MIILFSLLIFCMFISIAFTIKSRIERNSLIELFKRGAAKRKSISAKSEFSGFWGLNDINTALSFDGAFVIGLSSAGILFFIGNLLGGILFGLAAAISSFALMPLVINSHLKSRKIKIIKNSLEHSIDTLAGCLSAGMMFNESISEMVHTAPLGPLRDELKLVYDQLTQFNATPEKAFTSLTLRVPCQETEELRDAIILYQRIGGPEALSLLRAVVENLRKASSAKHEVSQYTKGAKSTSLLVGLGPVGYVLGMMVVSPDIMTVLFNTQMGKMALLISISIFLIGGFWLYNIFNSIDEF